MKADSGLIVQRLPAEFSARDTFDKRSLTWIVIVAVALTAAAVVQPGYVLPPITMTLAVGYLAMMLDRQWLLIRGLKGWAPVKISEIGRAHV